MSRLFCRVKIFLRLVNTCKITAMKITVSYATQDFWLCGGCDRSKPVTVRIYLQKSINEANLTLQFRMITGTYILREDMLRSGTRQVKNTIGYFWITLYLLRAGTLFVMSWVPLKEKRQIPSFECLYASPLKVVLWSRKCQDCKLPPSALPTTLTLARDFGLFPHEAEMTLKQNFTSVSNGWIPWISFYELGQGALLYVENKRQVTCLTGTDSSCSFTLKIWVVQSM